MRTFPCVFLMLLAACGGPDDAGTPDAGMDVAEQADETPPVEAPPPVEETPPEEEAPVDDVPPEQAPPEEAPPEEAPPADLALEASRALGGAGCGNIYCHALGDPTDVDRMTTTFGSGECEGQPLVVPGDPEASLVWRKVAGVEVCGRPMPLAGGPVPPETVEALRAWIAAGAPPVNP